MSGMTNGLVDLARRVHKTMEANGEMARIHNRMRVPLEETGWPVWFGETDGDPKAPLSPAREGCFECGR